ncbi:MAG: precorrin-6y C5,15-methyltransferase (decarboxylating) subunit CbiE [Methanobrevibacter sp.]|jgi:cobalt-precorrin-7 (C5)-methyltransferase|nr:precorrin-6y C5,15-methyltransferase (decarboxylating) subunit CbiE [Candidatus Methanoflexus mossambicus]
MSKLFIVGVGPGSKEYLTQIAIETVKKVDLVIGSQRAIDLFDEISNTIVFNVKNLNIHLYDAIEHVIRGKTVALLSTGDPGFSGLLKPILQIAKEKGLDKEKIEVIPSVSSLQLAAAKTHVSWDNVNIMTFHGKKDESTILNVIDNGKVSIVLPSRDVKDFAKFLIDSKIDGNRKIAICERLSYLDEKIVFSDLKSIIDSNFSYMCVVVIFPNET